MKRTAKPAITALLVASLIVACNSEEKKAEPSNTDTTAATATVDTTKAKAEDFDAVKIAPGLYTVAKDTMGIRVLNIVYKPGDSSAMHTHPDNALYVIDGGKTEFTAPDGSKQVVEFKSGFASIGGAEKHAVKNVGKNTVRAILVETTRPNKPGSFDESLDATKVASKYYKLVKDSLNMRIITVDYKPGEVSALHAHPDLVMYSISPAKAEFTAKDGTKREMTLDKGMLAVVPADIHSVKNIGNTHAKVVLVEVNRPQQ